MTRLGHRQVVGGHKVEQKMQGNNHPKVNRAYVAKVSGRKTGNAARKVIR